jgi:hypothetical protein
MIAPLLYQYAEDIERALDDDELAQACLILTANSLRNLAAAIDKTPQHAMCQGAFASDEEPACPACAA